MSEPVPIAGAPSQAPLVRVEGIISIPVDFTATAPTYKKVSQAGIKLVFMDSIRWA